MLTELEKKLVQLKANGFTEKEIAARRRRSEHTVKTQFNKIRRKMEVNTVAEVVAVGFRQGWLK